MLEQQQFDLELCPYDLNIKNRNCLLFELRFVKHIDFDLCAIHGDRKL